MADDLGAAWNAKADQDEQVASLLRTAGGPASMEAYHLQQSAEKRLKALLVRAGIRPPRSHDLHALAMLLPNEVNAGAPSGSLDALTAMAWATRYPGPVELDAESLEAVREHHAVVLDWIASATP